MQFACIARRADGAVENHAAGQGGGAHRYQDGHRAPRLGGHNGTRPDRGNTRLRSRHDPGHPVVQLYRRPAAHCRAYPGAYPGADPGTYSSHRSAGRATSNSRSHTGTTAGCADDRGADGASADLDPRRSDVNVAPANNTGDDRESGSRSVRHR